MINSLVVLFFRFWEPPPVMTLIIACTIVSSAFAAASMSTCLFSSIRPLLSRILRFSAFFVISSKIDVYNADKVS